MLAEVKITLSVIPMPILQEVLWAKRPEDVPPWDWTRGYPPVQPLSRFREDYDPDTPEEEIDSDYPLPSWLKSPKFYPRLVRKWASNDIWEPSPGSNLPPRASVSPLEAFQSVYKALQRDLKPLRPNSLTCKTIQEMARKAGILSSFQPNWKLSDEGVRKRFFGEVTLLREDTFCAWVEAAYFFRAMHLALKLREGSNLSTRQILHEIIRKLGFSSEDLERENQTGGELRVRLVGKPLEDAKRRGLDIALEYLGRGRSLKVSALENKLREEATQHMILEPASKFEPQDPIGFPSFPRVSILGGSRDELIREWEEWVKQRRLKRRGQSTLYFGFVSLIDLGLLQLLRRDYVACEWCGKIFSPRRRDARHCSDICRIKAWRDRRAKSKYQVE